MQQQRKDAATAVWMIVTMVSTILISVAVWISGAPLWEILALQAIIILGWGAATALLLRR